MQFRRYAGCPVCNLHLRSVVQRREEITAAGVREVVVFHADTDEVLRYEADLPLDVIADPTRRLYREFGIASSPRALADPRVWGSIVRAAAAWVRAFVVGRRRLFRLRPQGGRLGLPADFLIAGDGRIVASKHGEHANDQWSVDDLLTLAASYREGPET
ncbi:AhpC/TSA family protein [Actinocorallia lasiicapitis]